ncbi:hypothetical protein P4O66_016004 [Electrophorus voltai]|uniref:Calponin-homology (CH) domain-containing protein n=1 Tax=Electrophorus voltai TaxID=2609070 RepID=A0AAD8YXG8_9TELE|nr:hypothetical protein P4O66_016004 [Electrophorus voltai]
MKMAASQGGVGAVTALQGQHYPNVPHWNPGVMQHQQPLHTARSLDRALEDAVCSGILNVSGRKLRDYPGLNYDLTDTTQAGLYFGRCLLLLLSLSAARLLRCCLGWVRETGAASDLSKNRFGEIPPEVCMFAPLESLNLYHNCIKMIPEAIINLQMLTYLNISRNQLSVLPTFLFSLPLRVLVVSNNKLVSVPDDIGKAKDLMELDISCNEIQVLPAQMGRLFALRELNIRRNCLQVLPDELSDLPLIRLDFSCNKITEIPPSYRKLSHLQHIILDNNPIQSPPAQVCLKGKIHIFKYLNMQACRQDKKPDSLDLSTLGKRCLVHQLTDSMEDFYPSKNHGPDSGIGSDNGDKRLSTTEPSDDDTISLHSQVSETARADAHALLCKLDSNKADQDQYDFIDPNPDEEAALSEGDIQQDTPYVSCIKELERVLKTHQSKDKENWREESGSEKEQLAEEEEDELKEVLDLRKIAVQLLQQEQQNRFLSHSGAGSKQRSPSQAVRSASLDEGSSAASAVCGQDADLTDEDTAFSESQPSSSCSFDGSLKSENGDTEPKWPDLPPILNQNEDRRRNKYLRKDYMKWPVAVLPLHSPSVFFDFHSRAVTIFPFFFRTVSCKVSEFSTIVAFPSSRLFSSTSSSPSSVSASSATSATSSPVSYCLEHGQHRLEAVSQMSFPRLHFSGARCTLCWCINSTMISMDACQTDEEISHGLVIPLFACCYHLALGRCIPLRQMKTNISIHPVSVNAVILRSKWNHKQSSQFSLSWSAGLHKCHKFLSEVSSADIAWFAQAVGRFHDVFCSPVAVDHNDSIWSRHLHHRELRGAACLRLCRWLYSGVTSSAMSHCSVKKFSLRNVLEVQSPLLRVVPLADPADYANFCGGILNKQQYKCQSARRNSTENDCEVSESMHSSDFSTTLTVFGLKPRSDVVYANPWRCTAGSNSKRIHARMCTCTEGKVLEYVLVTKPNLESRLKVLLPDDVGAALMDGVILCHLANHIRPRSVASIHVPSPAVPKLSMAKCRRNVENFLDACKKLGVPQDKLCLPHHILEERGLVKVGVTVQALLDLSSLKATQLSTM